MQPAQLIAQLLDLRFGDVFLVFSLREVFRDFFQFDQDTFQRDPNPVHLGLGLFDQ